MSGSLLATARIAAAAAMATALIAVCAAAPAVAPDPADTPDAGALAAAPPARVLVIDSYHHGYPWSAGIRRGLHEVLGVSSGEPGRGLSDDGRIEVATVFMDTKRHTERTWGERSARRVMGTVEDWQPDVVIACDDNAVRYVVVPYLLGREVPVIYCGVNWTAELYGLPADNVTGMIEVEQTGDLLATLRSLADGDRLGLLVLDSTSGRRDAVALREQFGLDPVVRLVPDYPGWKHAFLELQDEVDMLIVKQNITGVDGWDLDDALAFTAAGTRIPTGTTASAVMACVLVSFIKSPEEQGRWAGRAALEVLAGSDPAAIEPGVNKESRVYLNMTLAERLDVRFPIELIERATFLEERWSR